MKRCPHCGGNVPTACNQCPACKKDIRIAPEPAFKRVSSLPESENNIQAPPQTENKEITLPPYPKEFIKRSHKSHQIADEQFVKKEYNPLKKNICTVLAFSPFILMLAYDLFPDFFEYWGWLILVLLIAIMCATMIHWKEESHDIESICAFIAILYGANGFINYSNLHLSFSDLIESFCIFVAGIGCWRYMIKSSEK